MVLWKKYWKIFTF